MSPSPKKPATTKAAALKRGPGRPRKENGEAGGPGEASAEGGPAAAKPLIDDAAGQLAAA